MGLKKQDIMLILLFILSVSIRIYFSTKTAYFSDDSSYFAIRQAEHISKTWQPIIFDSLSYGGRRFIFLPTFYYIVSMLSFAFSYGVIGKLLFNILAGCIVFVIYLITLRITKNRNASLIASILSAFLPIYMGESINSITSTSITIPLMFLSIFFFYQVDRPKYISYFLVCMILSVIISPISFLLILGLLIYSILCYIERIRQPRAEIELIFFSFFFFLWTNFIIFKKAFEIHGLRAVWQNIPNALLEDYFLRISILEAVYTIGLLPLILGILVIYQYLFKKRSTQMYLVIGLSLSGFILVWFRVISIIIALIFLGFCLIILSSQALKDFFIYLKKTKAARYSNILLVMIVAVVFITSIIPSIRQAGKVIQSAPTQQEIDTLQWIKDNTGVNATILAPFKFGNLITYFAERRNIADSNFLGIRDANLIVEDIRTMYTTQFKINSLMLLNKYNIDYIMLWDRAKQDYNISTLRYIDKDCFDIHNETGIELFEVKCRSFQR